MVERAVESEVETYKCSHFCPECGPWRHEAFVAPNGIRCRLRRVATCMLCLKGIANEFCPTAPDPFALAISLEDEP